jgi:hypothetical protein
MNRRAVYDSTAWHSTSMPLAATTAAANATRGSTIASVGGRGDAIAVFAWSGLHVQIEKPVTSLPVPDVVGQARCGGSGPGTGRASPTGAFRYVRSGAGYAASSAAALQVSITEPPPIET